MKRFERDDDDIDIPKQKHAKIGEHAKINSDWLFAHDPFVTSENLDEIACGRSLAKDLKEVAGWLKSQKWSFMKHETCCNEHAWEASFSKTDTRGLRLMKAFQQKIFSWLEVAAPKEKLCSALTLIYRKILSSLLENRQYGDLDVFDENMVENYDFCHDTDYFEVVFDSLVSTIERVSKAQEVEDLDSDRKNEEDEEEEDEEVGE